MNKLRSILSLALVLSYSPVVEAASGRMFKLPITAKIVESSIDGKGWLEHGAMAVTFVQAEGQFKSALARDGWAFQHKVPLAGLNSRALYTWKRGGRSVTLMLWRIDVGKTGFSWGVTDKGK